MLKFDEKYKKIPVIIFTARTQESDKKIAADIHADSYITKPFEPQALLDKVRELIA
jgi:DNA-binding response OmpR family regulator